MLNPAKSCSLWKFPLPILKKSDKERYKRRRRRRRTLRIYVCMYVCVYICFLIIRSRASKLILKSFSSLHKDTCFDSASQFEDRWYTTNVTSRKRKHKKEKKTKEKRQTFSIFHNEQARTKVNISDTCTERMLKCFYNTSCNILSITVCLNCPILLLLLLFLL